MVLAPGKKKVLVVTQYFWPEEFRVNELVKELVASGCDVDVVTGRPNYPDGTIYQEYKDDPEKFYDYCGATIYRVKNIPRGNNKLSLIINYFSYAFLTTVYLLKNMRNRKYNSIIAVQLSPIFSVIPALIYGKFQNIKVTTWVMDLWPDILTALKLVSNKHVLSLLTSISSRIYKASDSLLISSEGFRKRLRKFGIPDNKIYHFPQWVEDIMVTEELSMTKEFHQVEIMMNRYSDLKKIVFTGILGSVKTYLQC